jgi:DNA-binding CsgD family transcriptional regulator
MINQNDLDLLEHHHACGALCIVGSLCINQRHYIILSYDNTSDGLEDTKLADVLQDKMPLFSFSLSGTSCLIVEIPSSDHAGSSNISTLLSNREREIAQLVAQGQSNKQIAQQLQISKWTVLTHLRRIFSKLNVDSRAAMVYRLCSDPNNYPFQDMKYRALTHIKLS